MDVGLRAATLGLLLVLAMATPAGAETTAIGQIAPAGTVSNQCFECTDFQLGTAASSPPYVVPAGNWRRLVSWRIRGGPEHTGHAGLRVFRPTTTQDRFRLVGQAEEQTVPAKRGPNFPANLAVRPGDVLGLRTGVSPGDLALIYQSASFEDEVGAVLGDPGLGDTVGPGGDHGLVFDSHELLNVSATLYRPPPETTITKHPPAETSSRSARFRFRSDAPRQDFKCRLDDERRFKACSSPRRYRHLSRGRHVLEVQAIDAQGHADPTPADWTWRVNG